MAERRKLIDKLSNAAFFLISYGLLAVLLALSVMVYWAELAYGNSLFHNLSAAESVGLAAVSGGLLAIALAVRWRQHRQIANGRSIVGALILSALPLQVLIMSWPAANVQEIFAPGKDAVSQSLRLLLVAVTLGIPLSFWVEKGIVRRNVSAVKKCGRKRNEKAMYNLNKADS